ncbi:hypothetical protein [Scytonema sp. NUACC21]
MRLLDAVSKIFRYISTQNDRDFIDTVYDQNWELARAVKPGVMKYYYPSIKSTQIYSQVSESIQPER